MIDCPTTTPYRIGELVQVSGHKLKGYEWTCWSTGVIKSAAHERDFSVIDQALTSIPPRKIGWWTVSVDNPRAKGGYAFALLPEMLLSPHTCTSRCPTHPCLLG